MGDQGIDQRAGLVAGRGMHHQALGLVDDDDVVVLKHDIERDILARRLGRDGFRHVDCDRIARGGMISGVADGGALQGDGTGEDQRLQPRPRQFWLPHRQHPVEPVRALVARDDDHEPLTAVRRRVLFQRMSLRA